MDAGSRLAARLCDTWGVDFPAGEAKGITEILDGIRDGTIKAAVVMADGINPTARQLRELISLLGSLDTLIVSSVFDNDITSKADIVFAAAPFSEQTSTVTNIESRVQIVNKMNEPRFDELAGWEVFCGLANTMGSSGFDFATASEIFDAICATIPEYDGLSHDALSNGGVITTSNSRDSQTMSNFEITKPDFSSFARDGIYFAPGRVLHQPNRETTLGERNYLNVVDRVEYIELHPDDLEPLGISEGDTVAVVRENDGELLASGLATVSDHALRGIVQSTTLFAELATYMEECESPDPSPTVPSLDVHRVLLEVVARDRESELLAV